MDLRLEEIARTKYSQVEYLKVLSELAIEHKWFDLEHMIQHDMAKAVIADYSLEQGLGILDNKLYFENWESVTQIGWEEFSNYTGIKLEAIKLELKSLRESF